MTDSIIHEVRAIRDRHAASLGFDLDRTFADLQARQNKHAAEGWTIIPAPDTNQQLYRCPRTIRQFFTWRSL